MARLLIEDVTLVKGKEITAHVRFRGGATQTLALPLPLPAWALRKTSPEVVAEVDRLLDEHTDAEIAHILTERGLRSGTGKPVNALMVWRVRRHYKLKNRYQRLRERGMLTLLEAAKALSVSNGHSKGPAMLRTLARARLQRQTAAPIRATGAGRPGPLQVEGNPGREAKPQIRFESDS